MLFYDSSILKDLFLKIVGINKKILPWIFSLVKTVFFTVFFSIYKIVDIMDVYKSLNISIGTVMKNIDMLEFVPDHLKTKKMICSWSI